MKLRISDLTDAGIDVTGELAANGLNDRLNGESDSGIEMTSPVLVKMHARRTAGGAELAGTLSGSYKQSCGRCLEPVPRSFSIPATFLIKPIPRGAKREVDDVGVLYFQGEHCELESPLQETVLLSMTVYWSPEIEKSGVCSGCNKVCTVGMGGRHASTERSGNSGSSETEGSRPLSRLGELLKKLE